MWSKNVRYLQWSLFMFRRSIHPFTWLCGSNRIPSVIVLKVNITVSNQIISQRIWNRLQSDRVCPLTVVGKTIGSDEICMNQLLLYPLLQKRRLPSPTSEPLVRLHYHHHQSGSNALGRLLMTLPPQKSTSPSYFWRAPGNFLSSLVSVRSSG